MVLFFLQKLIYLCEQCWTHSQRVYLSFNPFTCSDWTDGTCWLAAWTTFHIMSFPPASVSSTYRDITQFFVNRKFVQFCTLSWNRVTQLDGKWGGVVFLLLYNSPYWCVCIQPRLHWTILQVKIYKYTGITHWPVIILSFAPASSSTSWVIRCEHNIWQTSKCLEA